MVCRLQLTVCVVANETQTVVKEPKKETAPQSQRNEKVAAPEVVNSEKKSTKEKEVTSPAVELASQPKYAFSNPIKNSQASQQKPTSVTSNPSSHRRRDA